MNLAEVIVAASVFLGVCSSTAQMGALSAHAMAESRTRAAASEQIQAQFFAVAPVIRAGVPATSNSATSNCGLAAGAMQQQLERGLPPLGPGLQRQLSLAAGGEQVVLTISAPGGLRRQRLLTPAAYGLCAVDDVSVGADPNADADAGAVVQEASHGLS